MGARTQSSRLRAPAGDRGAMLAALRVAGHRLTGPRRAIVDLLVRQSGKFTAEGLYGEVRIVAPTVGRATVYRTIERLVKVGLVERLHDDVSCHSYVVGDVAHHHHHLICSHCGQVWEFPECTVTEALSPLWEQVGFQVEGHRLDVFGRCSACAS